MYKKIFVPVDLEHIAHLDKSLLCAAELSKVFSAPVVFTGVTAATPSSVARTPEEYAQKLAQFAAEQADTHGISTDSKAMVSHDPAVDLDKTLLEAVKETGADLVVMQSHVPHLSDRLWPSNGGTIATHTAASVFLVR